MLARSLLALVALAAAAYVFRDPIFGAPVDVFEVVRGDIVQTVVASGRVMTPQRVSVGAVITERVARIPVEEGQTVRQGDVLIELDDRDERAAFAQAQAAVAQAEAKLRQLREVGLPAAEQALRQADANLRLARAQYERNVELRAKGFISDSALDDAKRNLDVAESQQNAARLQVRSNAPTGSDYLMAQTALSQAQAALAAAVARLEQTIIRAPSAGVLIARNVEPGDVVQTGKELMVLAPSGETQIVVSIDEKNLAQLRIGQKALASADAYPRERFAAELFYVNPGIDALRGSVEVKLRVAEPPDYLRQDMTVSVDIEVARRNGTLVAPADAVFDAAGPHPWVLVATDHHAVKTPVALGAKGEGNVEIVDGVVAGDRLVSAASGVLPGAWIRIASTHNAHRKP
ncbi:MAG TPA: efflux RND transporter periplasmic adaptor subunit [Casimicrobiaceae bacterium]|nr:efflux RND transporter periplasmic adaptor subunit [Casimicrobiaceae bacterium]